MPGRQPASSYFRDFADGRYDEGNQYWFIRPRDEVYVDLELGALVIGGPGVDKIPFCFRRGHAGVWAFYPIDEEWVLVAPTLAELERGWMAGDISV